MSVDDDDKPTVVLDLNALKKQKLKQEEDLANIGQELEFSTSEDEAPASSAPKKAPEKTVDTEEFAEQFLNNRAEAPAPKAAPAKSTFKVILFDFQSDFFQKASAKFPKGYDYQIAKDLNTLNKFLGEKSFQIVVFNYDVNPKAVNQLTAQIKQKFPHTKTMIMAKAISPEKAKVHAKTASGANGYYQFPLDEKKIAAEFVKIHQLVKKVG
jgi:hypothetical protein